jgi:SAM-dependent methyltransferase
MTDGTKNNWDVRYDQERYFYGERPNYFVARQLPALDKGRGLFLAEGEGRNAVFAAGLGHEVVAVDNSFVGRRKALDLAAANGVNIDYRLEDLTAGSWARESWDFVVLCFVHLNPKIMPEVHGQVAECLAPNGRLILLSFSKAQFGRTSGGPPRLEWLHDLAELKGQFTGLELAVEEKEVDLQEALGHNGLAIVIEMTGVK